MSENGPFLEDSVAFLEIHTALVIVISYIITPSSGLLG